MRPGPSSERLPLWLGDQGVADAKETDTSGDEGRERG